MPLEMFDASQILTFCFDAVVLWEVVTIEETQTVWQVRATGAREALAKLLTWRSSNGRCTAGCGQCTEEGTTGSGTGAGDDVTRFGEKEIHERGAGMAQEVGKTSGSYVVRC